MDTTQQVLLNAAVCLYAILGFSLSVFSSLLNLFGSRQAPKFPLPKPRLPPLVPRSRPIARTLRSCSDKPSTAPLVSKFMLEDNQRSRQTFAHRRSRSIPLITLDYFGSTEKLHKVRHVEFDEEPRSSLKALPIRKPLTFVIPPPPERERVEYPCSTVYDSEKSTSRLANLFSKEKKKEKENLWKVKEKNPLSPPALPQRFDASTHQPQVPSSKQRNGVSKRPVLSKASDGKVRPSMRRVHSAPTEERLTMRFDLTFSRTVEKKKSSTLRTQPYEAPFFCPPPVLPQRLPKSRSTLDLASKSPNNLKPSRSWTMKT